MDSTLQEKLVILKLGYIQKLKGLIFEFEEIAANFDATVLDELYSKVHTISGTSGMYGLSELSNFSNDFEISLKAIKNNSCPVDTGELREKLFQYIEKMRSITEGENNG